MIAAGGGAIVHIGSNAAQLTRPAALAYAAAKAALATYSKGLANQVGRHNVRVNLVSPGIIETSAFAARIRALADEAARTRVRRGCGILRAYQLRRAERAALSCGLLGACVSRAVSWQFLTSRMLVGGPMMM